MVAGPDIVGCITILTLVSRIVGTVAGFKLNFLEAWSLITIDKIKLRIKFVDTKVSDVFHCALPILNS